MLVNIWSLPPSIECPQSVNSFCAGSELYTAMNCIVLCLNQVSRGQSLQSDPGINFRNMQAMLYWSDLPTRRCRVNIYEPTDWFTSYLLSAVIQVGLHTYLLPTARLDSKSFNMSWFEHMIPSKIKRFFIRDLSDLPSQIIFHAWWASTNEGFNQPLAWNDSRHMPLGRFYLPCRIEETGRPGIIGILCQQVLRHPSDDGTSSMGIHLQAKADIEKLNELTEPEVTQLTS